MESPAAPRTPRLASPDAHDAHNARMIKGRTAFDDQFCVPAPLFALPPPGAPRRVRSPEAQRVAFVLPAPPPLPSVDEARLRYDAHLADFRDMLDRHHSEVLALIVATMEAQTNRYSGWRQSVFVEREADDEDLKAAHLQERIMRLRAKGWKRERFDPSRYEDLCEQAMAEL